MQRLLLFAPFFFLQTILIFAQEDERNKLLISETSAQKPNVTQAIGDKIIFKNGATTLMEVNDDGTPGLRVINDNGVLFEGTYNNGTVLNLGTGTRFHFYLHKGAIRGGHALVNEWDDANIGIYSVAFGYNTWANGDYSTAMGRSSTASGYISAANGFETTASGSYSFATGYQTTSRGLATTALGYKTFANANYSTAMGKETSTYGVSSTAMGDNAIANGEASTAIGYQTTAGGSYSLATGQKTTANGQYSTAMGNYVSTNSKNGSFIIGDNSTAVITNSGANNQLMTRFAGGYILYSNASLTTGVYMNGGISGWTNVSDRNKKENFKEINGEEILNRIKHLSVTEWNYKDTDPSIKYVGPVAQDFYNAFHLGGTDSLGINSIAIDGINLAGVKALEARTRDQEIRIKVQDERIKELERQNKEFRNHIIKVSELNSMVMDKYMELENKFGEIEILLNVE